MLRVSVPILVLCTTLTTVDEELCVSLSAQTTLVSFTLLVAGLISNLDISG